MLKGQGRMRTLSVGIIGSGIAYEHIAVGPAAAHGDADADAVTIWVQHRPQMSGRIFPVGDRSLRDARSGAGSKHRQVGAEAIGISALQHRLALFPVMVCGKALCRAALCGFHEPFIHREFWQPVFPAQSIGQVYDLLPGFRQILGSAALSRFLLRCFAGVGSVAVYLNAVG